MFLSKKKDRYLKIVSALIVLSLCLALITVFDVTSILFGKNFDNFYYPLEISNFSDLIIRIDSQLGNKASVTNCHSGECNQRLRFNEVSNVLKSFDPPIITKDGELVEAFDHSSKLTRIYEPNPSCNQQWPDKSNVTTFVIIVMSAVNNFKKRDVIRKSWYANNTRDSFSFKTVFSLAACDSLNKPPKDLINPRTGSWSVEDCKGAVDLEYKKHGDIMQISSADTYLNVTFKTLMNLQWINEECLADFAIFIDDDYLFNSNNLFKLIDEQVLNRNGSLSKVQNWRNLSEKNLYLGHVQYNSPPVRDRTSKWFISYSNYPIREYPPFINGGFVFLSKRYLRHLYYSTFIAKPFIFNDVYLAIIAHKLNVKPVHSNLFFCPEDTLNDEERALSDTQCIAWHDVVPDKLLRIWNYYKTLK